MLTAGYPKALIPFHVPNNIPSTSTWPSALDTSRTLFLLASTQGVSCRLVMNHLIYMYMFSLITPPPLETGRKVHERKLSSLMKKNEG